MIVKKRCYKKLYFIVILVGFFSCVGYTQDLYQKFDEATGLENREVFNGILYKNEILFVKNNHPFFMDNNFFSAKIIFKNQTYNIKMKYDLLNDVVLMPYAKNNVSYPVLLNSYFIKEFVIEGHKFVRILDDELITTNNFKNGFFEEKFKKRDLALYVKHYARLKENKKGSLVKYEVKRFKSYIIKHHERYLVVKRKRNLTTFFPKYKKEIKAFFVNKEINETSLINFVKNIKID